MTWTFDFTGFLVFSVIVTVIHGLAICLTSLRLYHRYKISRLWWDDCVAAVAGIIDCVVILDLWAGDNRPKNISSELIVRFKIGFLSIVSVEWATRIALALGFARIFPPGEKPRIYAISLVILFLFLFIAVVIQTVLFCTNDTAWISYSFIKCDFHGELLFFLLSANLFSDFLLVFSPLYVLRRLRLPDSQRRLIFSCFMGSALVSLACIVTTVFQFVPTSRKGTGEIRIILGYLEGSVSLFVCNLLVIVTYFYKVFRQRDIEEMPTTHNRSQEVYEADRTSRHPIPMGTREYITPITFTEISGAYFTDPILISRIDGGDSKINSEWLQATVDLAL